MDGWRRLPRALRFSFGLAAGMTWLRLFVVFWDADTGTYGETIEALTSSASFGALLMAVFGTVELARRSVHDATGPWVAVAGIAGRLAVYVGFLGVSVLRLLGKSSDTVTSMQDGLRWIGLVFAIVHAIGWAVASRDALVTVGLLLAAALGHESWRLVRWVFDDLSYVHALEIDGVAQIAQVAMMVVGACAAAKKVQTIHLPTSSSAGLARMSVGLWMRLGAAVVIAGLLMYTLKHELSSHRAFSGVLLAYLCAIGASLIYAHGALAACRVPDEGVPAWWTTAAAACSVMAAGILVKQLPWIVASSIGTVEYARMPDDRFGAGGVMIAMLGGMSIVLGLVGLAGYAQKRAALVSGSLASAAITVTILVCIGAGTVWYLPHVDRPGLAEDLLVFAGLMALIATVVAGVWIGKARVAFSHDPGMPAAIVIHRTQPPK